MTHSQAPALLAACIADSFLFLTHEHLKDTWLSHATCIISYIGQLLIQLAMHM